MSAYRDALSITSRESGERLELAEATLVQARGVVLLDDVLALRPDGGQVLCEVITRAHDPSGHRAAVEAAKALLAASSIYPVVSGMPLVWLAVEDCGNATIEVWRAS